MARFRVGRTLLAIVVFLGAFFSSALGAGPASAASPDCLYHHCYSTGYYAHGPQLGATASIPLTNMASGPANASTPNHISSEMWVGLDKNAKDYIEAGVWDGFQEPKNYTHCSGSPKQCMSVSFESGSGGSAACAAVGCGAYELFWADTNSVGGVTYQFVHVVRFLSPRPNSNVDVDIYYAGLGTWTVKFTGAYNYTGTSKIESAYHQTHDVEWGSEYVGPKTNGECGSGVVGAHMLGVNGSLIPVEMNTYELDQPYSGHGSLSKWTWSLSGAC